MFNPSCTKRGGGGGGRAVGITPQRFFKHNSTQNEPKLANFLIIQVRQTRNRWEVKKLQLPSNCGGGRGAKLKKCVKNGHF